MVRRGTASRHNLGQKGTHSGGIASIPEVIVSLKSAKTAEDLIVRALEKTDLAEIVRILRDWCGSRAIRNALDRLAHKDPVDRFRHARRHAVEIYAKQHNLTPANLMVRLVGVGDRADPAGTERYKLRKARAYLKQDAVARTGAEALARHWEELRPEGRDPIQHLNEIRPKI